MRMFLCVLGVVLLGAVAASANGLGVFGSYWDTNDNDDVWGGGAKLQIDLMENICVEARGAYFPEFGDSSGEELKVDIIPVEADAILKFPISDMLTPYVGGGVGYYIFDVENDIEGVDVDIDNEFGYFALAGVEIAFNEQVSLFAEGKYTWLEATIEASGDVEGEETGKLDGFGGNAGLMLKW